MKTIDIVLSLTSPLHVAYPDNVDTIKDTNKKISRTTKVKVYADGDIHQVPIYPANGFRGGLRRTAMRRLVKQFSANEGAVPGDLILGLSCGASSGSPDQTALSIEEILRARANVYMGLLGGGARLHSSAYRVSDMTPIIELTTRLGMVPGYCKQLVQARSFNNEQYTNTRDLVSLRTSIRVDDLFRVTDPEFLLSNVADPSATVTSHQQAVMANWEGRKTGDEGKSDVSNVMTIETVAPGTPFHFSIDLDHGVTEAQIGLLLLGLSDIFQENSFGGWVRCGFGKVRVEQIRMNLDDEEFIWDQLQSDNGRFALPPEATPYVEAANEAIGSLRIADMTPFFEDFSADAKAKKKQEAKAKKTEASA